MRLPPGFRFHPTDEELVVHYLKRKAQSWPLPAAVIPDMDIGKHDPWDLPGCQEGERYFFNLGDSRCRKAARSGYWKAAGKDGMIHGPNRKEVVGMKKVLVFHQGKPPHGLRTQWTMHEYRLLPAGTLAASISSPSRKDWVVCRVFKKSRASTLDADTMRYRSDNARSSPTSSCITDLSDEECSDIGEGEASSKLIASSITP